MAKQGILFKYENPLKKRFGDDFFKAVPTAPGVYIMRNTRGEILYVGKAKNLRNRLRSYKNARPSAVSRKVLRMIRLTRSIETRICTDETNALLTENQLLREHQPPFNVVNTYPETYYFITLEIAGSFLGERVHVRFKLTTKPDGTPADERDLKEAKEEARANQQREALFKQKIATFGKAKRFGVFKGRGRTRDSFGALLRVLSALEASNGRYYFPNALVKDRPPYQYALHLPKTLLPHLIEFLHGRSPKFLAALMEFLLLNEAIPKFIHSVITEDLKQLEEFYRVAATRVMKLKRDHGIKRRAIAQDEIDDLLVLSRPLPRPLP